jgi:DNA-nicking Smr family endonuclease
MASRRSKNKFHAPGGDGDSSRDGREGHESAPPEIDLHGCTLESGVRRLSEGLARLRAAGRPSALVITGKGYGSPGGQSVLGPGIDRWLRGEAARALGVVGQRKVRGGGAIEVSIKRQR